MLSANDRFNLWFLATSFMCLALAVLIIWAREEWLLRKDIKNQKFIYNTFFKSILVENSTVYVRVVTLNGDKYTGIWKGSGASEHYVDGLRHRVDGPAVEHTNGTKEWYFEGLHHRDDGPAIVFSDGTTHFWVHGQKIDETSFELYANMMKLKGLL